MNALENAKAQVESLRDSVHWAVVPALEAILAAVEDAARQAQPAQTEEA